MKWLDGLGSAATEWFHGLDGSDVQLILTAVALIFPAIALFYNGLQVKAANDANGLAAKAQREAAEPYVVVDIRPRIPGSFMLVLVIENIGKSLARDVRITVDPPIQSTEAELAEQVNRALARSISTLPPGRRLTYFFDQSHRILGSGLPMVYEFKIEASGPFGPMEALTYTVDLEAYTHTLLERESMEWSINQIARHTEAIAKAQKGQQTSLKKLAADVDDLSRTLGVSGDDEAAPNGSDEEPLRALEQLFGGGDREA